MSEFQFKKEQFVNELDYKYISGQLEGETQYQAACSVIKYRQPDLLKVGDLVPAVDLIDLDSGKKVNLSAELGKPLVLFFGSYT